MPYYPPVAPQMPQNMVLADAASWGSATPLVVSQFSFDPSAYPVLPHLAFVAVASNGSSPLTTYVKLYNVTDSEYVSSAALAYTTMTPFYHGSGLTIGGGAGLIKPTARIYEVRIWVDAPVNPADTIELGSASLLIS